MDASGGHLAELTRAEAELLSSHDTHQVIADRLGISPDVVRIYCTYLVRRSVLGHCTHVRYGDAKSDQPALGHGTDDQPTQQLPRVRQEDALPYPDAGAGYGASRPPPGGRHRRSAALLDGSERPPGRAPAPPSGTFAVQPAPYRPQGPQGWPGQQPGQPSVTLDPQYAMPPRQPRHQGQAQYQGTLDGQSDQQEQPERYDPELHRQRLHDEARHWSAAPRAPQQPPYPGPDRSQAPRRRNPRLSRYILAGSAAVIAVFIATVVLSSHGSGSAAEPTYSSSAAAANPSASAVAPAISASAAACGSRPDASGDIYVRMITPGLPAQAQELGGEWGWDYSTGKCLTSVQFMIATAPLTAGNCTQVGYVADNPGYDPNATPARPMKDVAAQAGPAC